MSWYKDCAIRILELYPDVQSVIDLQEKHEVYVCPKCNKRFTGIYKDAHNTALKNQLQPHEHVWEVDRKYKENAYVSGGNRTLIDGSESSSSGALIEEQPIRYKCSICGETKIEIKRKVT